MKRSLFQSATLVTALSVLKRALGFLYRILLSRLLTAEGMGLYQASLSFYFVFVTLGAGGIPVTVSRLICKNRAAGNEITEKHTLSAAFFLGVIITLPILLLFLCFGQKLPFLFTDERTILPTKMLFIGLTFSSLYHSLRGAFWGNKQLILPNVLELIEECINVTVGVLLLSTASSVEEGVLRATIAVAVTDTSCFFIAFIFYLAKGGKLASPKGQLRPLIRSATPITAMRVVSSLVSSLVAILLPAMLIKAGETQSSAMSLFGVVTGMVVPILFVPSTLIGSLSFVLVPELAENYYQKRYKTLALNIERGVLGSVYISCFLIPLFFSLGKPLGAITYSNALAGEMIALSSPILLPMSLAMITGGVLNSMGFEKRTFFYSFFGECAMLFCVLIFPRFLGVYAYTVAVGVSFFIAAACSLYFLFKRFQPSGLALKKGLTAILLMLPLSALGRLLYALLAPSLSDIPCLLICSVLLALLSLICYLIFGILPKKTFLKVFLRKK